MFNTAYYLHYILDTPQQPHYTEDLLNLSGEGFLWHTLKERHGFDAVAFLSSQHQKLQLKVFDAESEQIFGQERRKLFAAQKEVLPRIQPEQLNLSKPDKELLRWLLDRQKKAKNRKTALVCTLDALQTLCRHADDKDRGLLSESVEKLGSQGILVVRLPREAEVLQRELGAGSFLATLDPAIASLSDGKLRRPLLTLLEEQLSGRFADLGDPCADIENMLLRQALDRNDGQDSPEDIANQARFLTLCCRYAVQTEPALPEPLTRGALHQKLRDSSFRAALRSQVARLLEGAQNGDMDTLFQQAYAPQIDGATEPQLRYSDELVAKVAALPPLQRITDVIYSLKKVPEELCATLQTLWNLPRNRTVCDMIETCCAAIHNAYGQQDWDTLTDGLLLLQLCSRYLCASPDLEDGLQELLRSGREVLTLSAECFRLTRDQSLLDQLHHEKPQDKLTALQDKLYCGTQLLQQQQFLLKVERADLHDKIVFFNARQRDPQEISQFLSEKLQQMEKRTLDRQTLQTAMDDARLAAPPTWQEEPAPRRQIDWSFVGTRPWETESMTQEAPPQDEDDPFDFG